jgi:hypothetical protein
VANPPKNLRRTKPPKLTTANGAGRQPWSASLQAGEFVRETTHPKRWGRLIAPAPEPGHWLIQYSTGARMIAATTEIEAFTPTADERIAIDKASTFFEKAMARPALGS